MVKSAKRKFVLSTEKSFKLCAISFICNDLSVFADTQIHGLITSLQRSEDVSECLSGNRDFLVSPDVWWVWPDVIYFVIWRNIFSNSDKYNLYV